MSSPPTHYTVLHPKQGDITGSNDQAFGKGENAVSYIIGGIKAKTISAIGTCAPRSSIVQYLYAPRIHHNLGGDPKVIVGNASNKMGEFSCVYIPLTAMSMFVCMAMEKKLDGLVHYMTDLQNETRRGTAWHGKPDDERYGCALLPNFFILYFGQKPPTGDIATDDVKMAFATLGKGYEAWCTAADEALNSKEIIAKVRDNFATLGMDEGTWVKHYCDSTWTGTKMTLRDDGPHLPIMQADSDVYPVESNDIKKDYFAPVHASAVHPPFGTLTIQHPGELGQEAEAKKGVAKLMLLCLRGTVDVPSATITNTAFATPAPGMQSVMDGPRSGRAVAFSDLLRMTFTVVRDQDSHDIRSQEMSMTHVSKAMASHLLLGNLATNGVTNAHNEANAMDPSAFLPQRNLALVQEQQTKDRNFHSEIGMDVQDLHKTKISTGITRIGAITNMRDITSLCINVCAILSAITSDTAPDPILNLIMKTICNITLTRDWDDWITACGSQMPNLHLHFYSFIDRIWALLATGATDFSNTNVVSGNKPVTDLNLTHHVKAIVVLKALADQITLHQSQGTPILVQALVAMKYSPYAATYPIFPKASPLPGNPPESTTRQDAKRTIVTPDHATHTPATTEQSKKAKVIETRGPDRKKLGMFYLKHPDSRATDIFPRNLEEKICIDFTCKDRECTKENCPFKHPRNPRDMDKCSVISIARNFAITKKGWLSNYHFRNETTLPDDVKAMMGGSQGPTIK